MGTLLEGAWNFQNHKSGHLDKDSTWTATWMRPPPLVGFNSELSALAMYLSYLEHPPNMTKVEGSIPGQDTHKNQSMNI